MKRHPHILNSVACLFGMIAAGTALDLFVSTPSRYGFWDWGLVSLLGLCVPSGIVLLWSSIRKLPPLFVPSGISGLVTVVLVEVLDRSLDVSENLIAALIFGAPLVFLEAANLFLRQEKLRR